MSVLTDLDLHLFGEGNHHHIQQKLGAHEEVRDGVPGVRFALWAPNAQRVSVVGEFNQWDGRRNVMERRAQSGVWETFVPQAKVGDLYKFELVGAHGGVLMKADPYAFQMQLRPASASIVANIDGYRWNDDEWLAQRREWDPLRAPISIYELHPGSWRRSWHRKPAFLSWDELADQLIPYVLDMGYTHVELVGVAEHPFDGSWGYQVLGHYAPTARHGSPEDFMRFVDRLHQAGIGVFMDWVPAHFPRDGHGLADFDGTALYEHADPRRGEHQEWGTKIFNYGRNEVRNFLIANALFWIEHYHIDGLRVDAVASMLYLDYARKAGEWIPNKHGGHENLDAVEFLKSLNLAVYRDYPDTQTIAEESTAWPGVSRPVYLGGLGFGLKWNMGWMHDTLKYFQTNPIFRKYEHNKLTFSLIYAFTENFTLPLSHDEVVHGKGSLIGKMSGDEWQQFANLRLLLGYMWGHVGKKLLFMGGEIAQRSEWNHEQSLEWHVLQYPLHDGVRKWMRDLNRLYRDTPALFQKDFTGDGFEWIDCNDSDSSTLAFLRKGNSPDDVVLVLCNFTPVPRDNFQIGVPRGGEWRERLNSDAQEYGGGGIGNFGVVHAAPLPSHGRHHSLTLRLPPLATLFLTPT